MVHYDSTSDVMVMRVNTEVNTYTRVTQRQWLLDKLSLEAARAEELQAIFGNFLLEYRIAHSRGFRPLLIF